MATIVFRIALHSILEPHRNTTLSRRDYSAVEHLSR
jgi:hypothetical protein